MDPKRPRDVDDAAADRIVGDRNEPFDDDDRLRHEAARNSAGRTDLSNDELEDDTFHGEDRGTP